MKKLLIAVFAGLVSLLALASEELALKDNVPAQYTVKKGDTLWDISGMYLHKPWLWPEIWQVNPQIQNPHLIYPGDVLNLVYVDGKPRLTLQRGGRADSGVKGSVVKLSPQVRITGEEQAIPAIPLEKINAFLSRSRILEEDLLETAPYVLAGDSKRIISGAGDRLYARGAFAPNEKVYGIYRRGRVFTDPATGEVLGLEAQDIGGGKLTDMHKDVGTLLVNRSAEEIRVGDRLLPYEQRKVTATFFPSAPEKDVKGVIMAVEGGVTQVGTMDIVALNVGERDGIVDGTVLGIDKTGEVVRDQVTNELIQLPDNRAGLLMVFRTFHKMSYALVLDASQPLAVKDKVSKP